MGKCDVVLQSVLQSARVDMEKYAEEIDSGSCVVDFGAKCDAICNAALESFSSKAPSAGGDTTLESTFDTKIEELDKSLDAPLRVLYMKQLLLLRDKALKRY